MKSHFLRWEMNMENIINPEFFKAENIQKIKAEFNSNTPCKHLILHNFLSDEAANALYENFPKMEELNVKRKSLNENKKEDYHFERFHPMFSKVRQAIGSAELIKVWEEVTGFKNLSSTADGYGSGVHQGANGSFVDVHVDFNMHTEKDLHRRLNMLIYLNKNWKEEYGGHLELWDVGVKNCIKAYPPTFNTAVIFITDDKSPHGVRKVNCPEGESRKSFYAYYYTPIGADFVYRDSKFTARPEEGAVKGFIVQTKEAIKVNAKRLLKALGMKSLDFQDKN